MMLPHPARAAACLAWAAARLAAADDDATASMCSSPPGLQCTRSRDSCASIVQTRVQGV